MMYIQHANGQRTWHVGEPNPIDPRMVDTVYEVQADEDELLFILNNFNNLPSAGSLTGRGIKRVQRWFGDHAKFIVANLEVK